MPEGANAVTGHARSLDGTRIGFERTGSGAPLLLVHGTSADRTRWPLVLPRLAQRFTVYAMDRRGRGLSGDAGRYDIEREFEDAAAVIDAIGEPVHVLGHSFGALVALEAALRTRNVRRLALYEPLVHTGEPFYPEGLREHLESLVAGGEPEAALVTFLREAVGYSEADLSAARTDARSWAGRVGAAHTIAREFADADYRIEPERLARLEAPALLLSGGATDPHLRRSTEMVHHALPGSRVEVMEGEGHIAMNTSPDRFVEIVTAYFAGR